MTSFGKKTFLSQSWFKYDKILSEINASEGSIELLMTYNIFECVENIYVLRWFLLYHRVEDVKVQKLCDFLVLYVS